MTTILAVQGSNYAVIGYDSRVSSIDDSHSAQISTLSENNAKVALNGKYLLGAAGDVRAINILHHVFIPPALPANMKEKKLDKFITNTFVPALRDCFEKQGYAMPDNDEKEHIAEQASDVLIAVMGKIYIVDNDYSWSSDASGVYGLGSGAPYALGAYTASLPAKGRYSIFQAKNNILKSLSVAAKYDPFTGAPFRTHVQDMSK